MTGHSLKSRLQLAVQAVNRTELIELTQKLVRIRSVVEPGNPEGNEARAAHFVAEYLRRQGFEVTVQEVEPGRPNVIADWAGSTFDATRHRTLMFEGHTDVVTEGDRALWSVPPFEARIEEGKLYGRGSADMKGGVAAAITAAVAVKNTNPDLPGRIRLGIVVDEEGMMAGIKHFIRSGWAQEVDGAIVCEPEENELCLHQKGAIRVGVTFEGLMSHGAMPYAGVNPIPALAQFITAVGEFEREQQAQLGEHRYLGWPWFTPTIIRAPREGVQQLNVMPATAYVALDIRTVPGQEHEQLIARLRELANEASRTQEDLTARLDVIEERPWTETPASDPLVEALQEAYEFALGRPAPFGGVPGATDGTFLHAWANVPIVTVGPGDRHIPHQRDEYVRVDELYESARLYAAAAVRYLAG